MAACVATTKITLQSAFSIHKLTLSDPPGLSNRLVEQKAFRSRHAPIQWHADMAGEHLENIICIKTSQCPFIGTVTMNESESVRTATRSLIEHKIVNTNYCAAPRQQRVGKIHARLTTSRTVAAY